MNRPSFSPIPYAPMGLSRMRAHCNALAQGSFSYLAGTALEGLCRLPRTGEEAPDD